MSIAELRTRKPRVKTSVTSYEPIDRLACYVSPRNPSYDDLATVGKFYVQVKAYIDFLLRGVDERGVLVIPGSSLGDWVAPIDVSGTAIPSGTPPIPGHRSLLLSTAVLLENLQLFIDGAAALGKAADAAKYSARRVELLAQFRTMHFNATGKGVFEDMCGNYTELEPNPIR